MAANISRFAGDMAGEPFVQCSVGNLSTASPRSRARIEDTVFNHLMGQLISRLNNQSASRPVRKGSHGE